MSATLGDTSEIERHIHERTRREVSRIHSEERPVPLDFDFAEIPIHESVEALLSILRSGGAVPVVLFARPSQAMHVGAVVGSTRGTLRAVTLTIDAGSTALGALGISYGTLDQLRVPATLPPGEYVLGLRW